jgi:hypothetical protein
MRFYRDRDGAQQLFLKDEEIDEITEGELLKAGLMPTVDTCRVDIEGFIERHLGVRLDVGAALDDDVLGVTELRRGEPKRILINRDLTDAALEIDEYSGTLGRWRATLAHEGAHVLLHGLLFDLNADQQALFDEDPAADERVIRCYKRDTSFGGRSRDPREFQANKGMAALLMPRSIFGEAARELVAGKGPVRNVDEQIARRFEVSRQAAQIRLSELGFLSANGAATSGLFR